MNYRGFILTGAAALALSTGTACLAQANEHDYSVAPQDLKYALRDIARQSGLELVAPSAVLSGKRAPALQGHYSAAEALEAVLAGSGLTAEISEGTIFIRGREVPPQQAASTERESDIVVTGTRIRGAQPATQVIIISREAMKDAGQNTLADVIRTIPQNFGGGQNAGVGLNVPENRGTSGGSGSTLNLRGLGSDATLTLLNGQRLAYNVARQSIDISTIPVIAIERLEIVADGASALYGSDAVGGVANIILRRDYDGLTTRARFGASTDGGNQDQQYSALTGTTWSSGGAMVAYEFERDTAIRASDRKYAAATAPGLFLYPAIKHHNVVASAHQDLGDRISFEIDGLYNNRSSHTQYALDLTGDVLANGVRTFYRSEAFTIAPTIRLRTASDWELNLQGSYGEDRSRYDLTLYSNRTSAFHQVGCYCNASGSAEANANGSLFALPAGNVKVALGGGWRVNDFHSFQTSGGAKEISISQDTYYAFGEVSVPAIAPDQGLRWAHRLDLTAAVRWEDYPGVDKVATPKFGIVFAPSPSFDLKATWGKSFKAPTLFQLYNTVFATLYRAASRGGTGYPATATAILLTGGNPDLKPERATTWSATLAVHPVVIPGASLEITYFDVDYRGRIVTPITFPSRSLNDPQYADLVDLNPSLAAISAITGGNVLFQNAAGAAFDPSNVVAIIHNTNLNAATQRVGGVDASAQYLIDLPNGGTLSLQGSGSYIRLTQRLSALQPEVSLAGTIFNIPHFRARGGAVWKQGPLTFGGFVNYAGGVRDVRFVPVTHVRSMTTFDLSATYAPKNRDGFLSGFELGISAQNLFNRSPSPIRASQPYEAPYDSTNYSPFGRVLNVSVTKKW